MSTLLLAILTFFSLGQNKLSINISIDELNNSDGNMVVAIYTSDQNYEDEKHLVIHRFNKSENITNGVFTCNIELPPGEYGIAFHDDENKDGKMNYSFFGIPEEGYGFSNFIHTGFSKPKYSDFQFSLTKNISEMKVKLRYF